MSSTKKLPNFNKDDKLDRKRFADNLTEIFNNSEDYRVNNSLVIALDSAWGTGKTTFIKMWANDLLESKKEEFHIVYYNSWGDDDWKLPLISIFHNLLETNPNKKDIELIKSTAKNLIKDLTEKTTGIKLNKLSKETNLLEDYSEYKKLKKKFINLLKALSKNKKIIFFIDELDRCRPIYAIETLEVIKHFFNVDNMVFVFALDMEQLSHSISTIYGENMDSEGYLRRFFDLHFKIPAPTVSEYVDFLFEQHNLDIDIETEDRIIDFFIKFKLSLRDIDVMTINIKLLINTTFKLFRENCLKESFDVIEIYTFLLILKYKHLNLYNNFINNSQIPNQLINNNKRLTTFFNQVKNQMNVPLEIFLESKTHNSFAIFNENNNKQIPLFNHICNNINYQNLFIDPFDFYINGDINEVIYQIDKLKKLTISQYIERKLEIFNYTPNLETQEVVLTK